MNPFRADLHCHSSCSDGSLSPVELLQLAKEVGLSGLSITDHDSVDAYQTAIPYAKELGIALLPGVEFSTMLDETSIHILGYGITLDHPAITGLVAHHAERRKCRNEEILEKLAANGMPISQEELVSACTTSSEHALKHTIGRPHIAIAMIRKGYITDMRDAFRHHLGEGKPCFAQGASVSAVETIDIIHEAKGLAIVAHPHLIKDNKALRKLLELPIDGLECYYGNFSQQYHKRWLKLAKKHDWLITGGSDFHGDIKPFNPLGASWVDENLFQAINNRLATL